MSETQAASSPAEVEDVFRGENLSVAEYNSYRETNELPERFKAAEPADTAPADGPEETESESAGESESPQDKPQEKKPHLTANQRVDQLRAKVVQLWQEDEPDLDKITKYEATIDKIELGAGIKRKTATAPVTQQSPVQTLPQQPIQAANYDAWADRFIAEEANKWTEQWIKENPDKSWESANAAMFRHMRSVERQFEQQHANQQAIATRIREGEALYGKDFGRIAEETAGIILDDPNISPMVKQRFSRSGDLLAHLTYAIGGDQETRDEFVRVARSDPYGALDRITLAESQIRTELAQAPDRNEKGQFKAKDESPAKKTTSAPKPPSPVGGSSRGTFDVNDESIPADEWLKGRNADLARKGKR